MGASGRASGKWIWAVLALAVLIGGAFGVLYAMGAGPFKASNATGAAESELARFAAGSITALETPTELAPAPDYVFHDREGGEVRFADFHGKIVVVNLWAMWCAPCRTEMPTLAALASHYADRDDFMVLPVNVDDSPDEIADATSFIDVNEPLPLYNDARFQLPFEFPGRGKMPQTIVLDRDGRIRAWFAGEADWSSPEAIALLDALLAEDG